jgi:hypothetical protein
MQNLQNPIDFKANNRHSLDTHKWFLHVFVKAEMEHLATTKAQEAVLFKKKVHKTLYYIVSILWIDIWLNNFVLAFMLNLHLNSYGKLMLVFVSLLTAYIYETRGAEEEEREYKKQPIVFLRFTRPSIFYKNTHYIFIGTQLALQRAFQYMRDDIEAIKKEDNFGRGDHDNLLDMPLDTFCNALCECLSRTAPSDNYNCSHWNLYRYDSEEELLKQAQALEMRLYAPNNDTHNYNGFHDEIIYL